MIKHVRVDERLIHGQVASVWVNFLGCDRIIVANDAAPKDEMMIGVLKLACPVGVKLSILSVDKAGANIKGGNYDGDKVFLITQTIGDIKRMVDSGVELPSINVGNLAHKEGGTKIKNSVSLTDQDILDIKSMLASGQKITAQMVPSESGASIATFM